MLANAFSIFALPAGILIIIVMFWSTVYTDLCEACVFALSFRIFHLILSKNILLIESCEGCIYSQFWTKVRFAIFFDQS
jgi:hypothetical protein